MDLVESLIGLVCAFSCIGIVITVPIMLIRAAIKGTKSPPVSGSANTSSRPASVRWTEFETTLKDLVDRGLLQPTDATPVWAALTKAQQQDRSQAIATTRSAASQRLSELLRPPLRTTPLQRAAVIQVYEALTDEELAQLPEATQFDVVRVLSIAGRVNNALQILNRLVARQPVDAATGGAALFAARLALTYQRTSSIEFFLDKAEQSPLTAAQQSELARIRADLHAGQGMPPPVRTPPVPAPVMEPAPVLELVRLAEPGPPLEDAPPFDAGLPFGAGLPSPSTPPAPVVLCVPSSVPQPPVVPLPPVEPLRPFVPPQPVRPMSEWVASFLAEKNIRWGELIGGLLVICSSLALVISQWEFLEQQPVVQFLVFVGTTAALFFVGLYTAQRWQLPTTSHGVLIIATLLVPLNFLAIAGSWRSGWSGLQMAPALLALAVLGALTYRGGQLLVPPGARWLTLANLGAALSLLAAPRLVTSDLVRPELFSLALALPTVTFVIAALGAGIDFKRIPQETLESVQRLLLLLGLATFGWLVAVGLAVGLAPGVVYPWVQLAFALELVGCAWALVSLRASTRISAFPDAALTRTLATAFGLWGAVAMLTAQGLAFQQPLQWLELCVVNAGALAAIAVLGPFRPLHGVAALCGVLACVSIWFLLLPADFSATYALHNLSGIAQRLGQTGSALVAAAVGLVLVSGGLHKFGDQQVAWWYREAALVTCVVSGLLVLTGQLLGAEHFTLRAALAYATLGSFVLLNNIAAPQLWRTLVGLALLLLATLTVWPLTATPWGAAVFATAAVVLSSGVHSWLAWRARKLPAEAAPTADAAVATNPFSAESLRKVWCEPAEWAAFCIGMLALAQPAAVWGLTTQAGAGLFLWIGLHWLVLASLRKEWHWLPGFQVLLFFAVVLYFPDWTIPFWKDLSPVRQALFSAANLCLFWTLTRAAVRQRPHWYPRLAPDVPAGDRPQLLRVCLVYTTLQIILALPRIAEEHLFVGTSLPGWMSVANPAGHAWGGWAVLMTCLVIALWDGWKTRQLVVFVALTVAAAVMGSALFRDDLACGSALRWGLALVYVGWIAVLVCRDPLLAMLRRWQCKIDFKPRTYPVFQFTLTLLTLVPTVLLSAQLAGAQFTGATLQGPISGPFHTIGTTASLLPPLLLFVGGLLAVGIRDRAPLAVFVAGQLVTAMAMVITSQVLERWGYRGFDRPILLLPVTATVASAWTIVWMWGQQRLNAQNWGAVPRFGSFFIGLQMALAVGLNLLWLVPAVAEIVIMSPRTMHWSPLVGTQASIFAWLALVGMVGLRRRQRQLHWDPQATGMLAIVTLGVAACHVQRLAGNSGGYWLLLLGTASATIAIVAVTWWLARRQADAGIDLPARLAWQVKGWVVLLSVLALGLAAKAVFLHSLADRTWLLGAAATVLLVGLAHAALAVWLRNEGWAFVAGLGVNLAALLLVIWTDPRQVQLAYALNSPYLPVDSRLPQWSLLLLQTQVIATALVACWWLLARRRLVTEQQLGLPGGLLLQFQVNAAVLLACLLVLIPAVSLFPHPHGDLRWLWASGSWTAWLGCGLTLLAMALDPGRQSALQRHWTFTLGSLFVALLCAALPVDATGPVDAMGSAWTNWRVLLSVSGGLAVGWFVLNSLRQLVPVGSVRDCVAQPWAATVLSLVIIAYAVEPGLFDAEQRTAATVALVVAVVCLAGTALVCQLQTHLYLATFAWLITLVVATYDGREPTLLPLLGRLVFAAGTASLVWLACAQMPRWPAEKLIVSSRIVSVCAILGTVLLTVLVAVGIGTDLAGTPLVATGWPAWIGWLSLCVGLVCTTRLTWEEGSREAYALGLLGAALVVERVSDTLSTLMPSAVLALGLYVLFAAVVVRLLQTWRRGEPGTEPDWYRTVQVVATVMVAAVGTWVALGLEFPTWQLRLCGGLATLAAAAGLATMYLGAIVQPLGSAVVRPHRWLVGLLVLAALQLGWATLSLAAGPIALTGILGHGVLVLTLSSCLLNWFVRPRVAKDSVWASEIDAVQQLALSLILATTLVFAAAEWQSTAPDVALALPTWISGGVLIGLIGMQVTLIAWALQATPDPFRWELPQRTLYVYAAEWLLLLTGVHFVACLRPWLPYGFLAQFWPVLALAAALVVAGIAQFCSRRQLLVLVSPLENTVFVLPLAPIVLAWFPDYFPRQGVPYWTVLLGAALLYGYWATVRRSWICVGLCAVAANGALWSLLLSAGFAFEAYPHLWLIPAALSVLIAEFVNHDRLTTEQSAVLRYLSLGVIYLSTATDLFLDGLAQSMPWGPVSLLILALIGLLAGLLLRIRSFVILGGSALVVVLATMLYFATVDLGQKWILYVTGIAAGMAMIVLFAIFEKKRNDWAEALAAFQQWDD